MVCTDLKSKAASHDLWIPSHIWPNEPHGTIFRLRNYDFRLVVIFRIKKKYVRKTNHWGAWEPPVPTRLNSLIAKAPVRLWCLGGGVFFRFVVFLGNCSICFHNILALKYKDSVLTLIISIKISILCM
jgi:hypothetical protein